MKRSDKLIKVYCGPEASAALLKARLEEAGISALIKNDSPQAFFVTVPSAVDLYIEEKHLKEAEQLLKEFLRNNQ